MTKNLSKTYDAFCDTSFLLSYYFAFGELHDNGNGGNRNIPFPPKFFPHYKKITKTIPIAEKLFCYENKISLVYNYGVLLELIEKLSEDNLRNNIASHIPLLLIQNKSRKNYSELAKWLIEDCKRLDSLFLQDITPLQKLVYNCFEATEFDFIETGLWGIEMVDYFKEIDLISRLKSLAYFSRCQIGFADIHHLLSAESLGCKYFFTYDSDFILMKKEIKKAFDLEVMTNPEEILKVV